MPRTPLDGSKADQRELEQALKCRRAPRSRWFLGYLLAIPAVALTFEEGRDIQFHTLRGVMDQYPLLSYERGPRGLDRKTKPLRLSFYFHGRPRMEIESITQWFRYDYSSRLIDGNSHTIMVYPIPSSDKRGATGLFEAGEATAGLRGAYLGGEVLVKQGLLRRSADAVEEENGKAYDREGQNRVRGGEKVAGIEKDDGIAIDSQEPVHRAVYHGLRS